MTHWTWRKTVISNLYRLSRKCNLCDRKVALCTYDWKEWNLHRERNFTAVNKHLLFLRKWRQQTSGNVVPPWRGPYSKISIETIEMRCSRETHLKMNTDAARKCKIHNVDFFVLCVQHGQHISRINTIQHDKNIFLLSPRISI